MKLTIFTPTYNRAALLPRLYDSLLRQTSNEFEWLIVDDGSTDATAAVVERFVRNKTFPVHYVRKENGGKHTAHNLALKYAQCEWFFCVDSDDWLAPKAVNGILKATESAPPDSAGIVGHKVDQAGCLLCSELSEKFTQTGLYSLMNRNGGWGEYALLFRTNILKQYSFPEIMGEQFMTESVLYDRLELEGYTVHPINAVLEICEYQPEGLSSNPYRLLLQNPTGYQIYHSQRINLSMSFVTRLRHCICYRAFLHMSKNRNYLYTGPYNLLVSVAWLPGVVAAYYYRLKGK